MLVRNIAFEMFDLIQVFIFRCLMRNEHCREICVVYFHLAYFGNQVRICSLESVLRSSMILWTLDADGEFVQKTFVAQVLLHCNRMNSSEVFRSVRS